PVARTASAPTTRSRARTAAHSSRKPATPAASSAGPANPPANPASRKPETRTTRTAPKQSSKADARGKPPTKDRNRETTRRKKAIPPATLRRSLIPKHRNPAAKNPPISQAESRKAISSPVDSSRVGNNRTSKAGI